MNRSKFGSLWMLVAALGFAVMGVLVKFGAQKFSNVELVFYRSLFGLVSISAFIVIRRYSVITPVLAKQMARAAIGFISLALFFYAIAHLPLATAVTLNYTSPLFLALFSPLLLGEKPAKWLFAAVVFGFAGIVLLLNPTFQGQHEAAAIVGLLSGVGAAMAYVHVKQLGNLHEPEWRTVFYFTLVSTFASGIWLLYSGFQTMAFADLPTLSGLGVSATLAQMAMTRAYKTGDTLVVGSLAYTTVVLASLFGVWLWQEQLSAQEWLAILFIIFSGILALQTANKNNFKGERTR
ncbi:MAG: DMT family transporter [Gammaproteobacteria bacterium]